MPKNYFKTPSTLFQLLLPRLLLLPVLLLLVPLPAVRAVSTKVSPVGVCVGVVSRLPGRLSSPGSWPTVLPRVANPVPVLIPVTSTGLVV